ncbi:MAG: hypothetical protein OYK82_05670 [Gammaproteobacteria bacterium]|nr:hypothetical protein [Gammaproteobacteria bacterium]
MPELAFFPWIELECDIDAEGYSLKRFVRGRLPESDSERQATLDAVLAPYRDFRDEPIRTAVILAAHGRGLTEHPSEEDRADLFLFGELFAFAALAAREFFTYSYCNRDQLRLVIQAFTDPGGGAFMALRRRDGAQRTMVTGDRYSVQAPAHVSYSGRRIKPDCALLEALLMSRDLEEWPGLYRGIALFNQANTDAPDMSTDTELVLSYATMEQILGIASRADQKRFPEKFAQAWRPSREVSRSNWRSSPSDRPWKKDSLRACWALDLKICRGNLAHGHRESAVPSQWTVHEHLLFTSFTIPLLVKQALSDVGLYGMTDRDQRDINVLEPLLNLPDIFAAASSEEDQADFPDEDFAWRQVVRQEDEHRLLRLIDDLLGEEPVQP